MKSLKEISNVLDVLADRIDPESLLLLKDVAEYIREQETLLLQLAIRPVTIINLNVAPESGLRVN